MANVRDSDTSLWLHNKLGTSNDSWTGGSICGQLNAEVLRNIKDCFPDLQTQVKLKLLLSFFHIPRRNIEEWRIELEQILDVAVGDSELWVSMLAEALKTYPVSGSLNTEISDLDDVRPIFTDLVNDLRKLVKKQAEQVMLPMECHYLNKGALISVVGQQPSTTKHFTLKKKPKSSLLRADLLQKSSDAASNLKKASAPVIPVRSRGMPRKMTDTTPLKGIPSRLPGNAGFRGGILSALNVGGAGGRPPPMSRPPAGRKEGGVKLLDIADQPLGYAQARKRKRQQDIEEARKLVESSNVIAATAAAAAQQANTAASVAVGGCTAATENGVAATNASETAVTAATAAGAGGAATPDYAVGLQPTTPAPYAPPSTPGGAGVAVTPIITPATPVITVTPTSSTSIVTSITAPLPSSSPPALAAISSTPSSVPVVVVPSAAQTAALVRRSGLAGSSTIVQQTPQHLLQQTLQSSGVAVSAPSAIVTSVVQQTPVLAQLPAQQITGIASATTPVIVTTKLPTNVLGQQQVFVQQPLQQHHHQSQAQPTLVGMTSAAPNPVTVLATNAAPTSVLQQHHHQQQQSQVILATQQHLQQQQAAVAAANRPIQQVTHIRIQSQPATNTLQRRGLALTREQMLEAQDMFRTANKVTRPEKALILGFMAGSRDNPCPHLGNIVTIKLSEDQENVLQPDETYLTMLVETHFQMNYNNGEWKRIKKYRHIENLVDQLASGIGQATALV